MGFNQDWYDGTVSLYTRFIRVYSHPCAQILIQIRSSFGALVAYQAAFAIMQLRTEVERTAKVNDVEKYRHLLNDYPEALPLFDLALQRFLDDAIGQKNTVGHRDA